MAEERGSTQGEGRGQSSGAMPGGADAARQRAHEAVDAASRRVQEGTDALGEQARNTVRSAGEWAQQSIGAAGEQARRALDDHEAARALGDNASEMARNAGQRAQDLTNQAKEQADALREQAGRLAHQAVEQGAALAGQVREQLTSQAGNVQGQAADRLSEMADAVRQTAQGLRGHEDWLAQVVDRGADELGRLSDTLRSNDMRAVMTHAQDFARRQPALFLGASLAMGFALARLGSGAVEGATQAVRSGMGNMSLSGDGAERREAGGAVRTETRANLPLPQGNGHDGYGETSRHSTGLGGATEMGGHE